MKNNKLIQRLIISLQIFYIILFFSQDSGMDYIYFEFWVNAIITISSLILSMMNIINKGKFKVLFMLISIVGILFTIFVYLLPEAGIPPLIKLF